MRKQGRVTEGNFKKGCIHKEIHENLLLKIKSNN